MTYFYSVELSFASILHTIIVSSFNNYLDLLSVHKIVTDSLCDEIGALCIDHSGIFNNYSRYNFIPVGI